MPVCKPFLEDDTIQSDHSIGGLGVEATSTLEASPAFRQDRIAYIADLIAELSDLSQTAGCTTLAGILRLAETEAHLQLAASLGQASSA
jgi:hypothetical protein